MPWTVNIEEQMPWHPKVARLSDQAFRLYVHAVCWASRAETDGAIPSADLQHVAPGLRRRESLAAELVTAGLFEPTGSLGWVVHDYLDYNPSSYTRRAMDEQKVASGSKGAHTRWHAKRAIHDPDCKHCIAAGQ